MLDRRTRSHIERALEQIEQLMHEYGELLAVPDAPEPGLIERTALGAVLQSFYNGGESIFQTVAKRVDQDMPAGADWHRQLWTRMARGTAVRPPLITPATADRLEPYLGFRHIAQIQEFPYCVLLRYSVFYDSRLLYAGSRPYSDQRKRDALRGTATPTDPTILNIPLDFLHLIAYTVIFQSLQDIKSLSSCPHTQEVTVRSSSRS